ncbi:MAG: hypothetical protein ACYTBJ_21450, partial [Planctomycetota bacterium]
RIEGDYFAEVVKPFAELLYKNVLLFLDSVALRELDNGNLVFKTLEHSWIQSPRSGGSILYSVYRNAIYKVPIEEYCKVSNSELVEDMLALWRFVWDSTICGIVPSLEMPDKLKEIGIDFQISQAE